MSVAYWTDGDTVVPFRRPTRRTFRELSDAWLRTEGARLVEPRNEQRHIAHLRALWGLTEGELRPYRVKEALLSLLKPSGPLSPATVNKVRGTGRRIIREAQLNDEWTGPNPFEIVRRLRETRPSHRVLSLGECRALLPHLRPDRLREAMMMLYLGLRPGEWKALKREDVDTRAWVLTVRRSNGRDQTKTGKVRVVPIPLGLRPTIGAALRESPPSCRLVFPGRGGKRQRFDAKLSRMLRAAMRRAGLVSGYVHACRRRGCGHREEFPTDEQARCARCGMKLWATGIALAVRFYDLRHSAATLHREAGCDPLVIQIALGHAAENLTDGIYTHLSLDYLRRELDKLSI